MRVLRQRRSGLVTYTYLFIYKRELGSQDCRSQVQQPTFCWWYITPRRQPSRSANSGEPTARLQLKIWIEDKRSQDGDAAYIQKPSKRQHQYRHCRDQAKSGRRLHLSRRCHLKRWAMRTRHQKKNWTGNRSIFIFKYHLGFQRHQQGHEGAGLQVACPVNSSLQLWNVDAKRSRQISLESVWDDSSEENMWSHTAR